MEILQFENDRLTMEYVRFGHGPRPLVILPGVSVRSVLLTADAVAAAFDGFCETHTVFLFDRKKEMRPGYRVEDMAKDTAAVIRALGLRGADLFGASQGGMIALRLAVLVPGWVRSAVVASATAFVDPDMTARIGKWTELARSGQVAALNRSFAERVYSSEYRAAWADAFRAAETLGTPEELERFALMTEACADFDTRADLPRVTCPVLAVGSRQDRVFGGGAAEAIASGIGKGARCYLYEGYGHAVYDEAPDFRPRMADFFAGIKP